ncbi:hypothetical protein MTZ49_01885 [Entomomonas sp. E2T0]|uniref:hypothetical protein n=1 Tax=Entomomonas sp. E2T0 TaxID=2930213 RepID=UPI002228454D|nr:hypothetical protein [Entomomonas sp. E2T0]UYZ84355.1 hypothetical protein MTZ49_01885 [Entomomonas sp. E2T0]
MAKGEEVSKYKIITNKDIEDAKKRLDEAYTVNYPQQQAFIRKDGRDYMSNLGKAKWGFTRNQCDDIINL